MQPTDYPILLVEESPSVLRALELQIELAGFDRISTHNGLEALEVLETEKDISLIISDWLMPKMDGLDLLSQIRQSDNNATTPFLMVTGKDTTADAVTALRFGANDYIVKPYHPDELLARIRNLVKLRQYEKELEGKALYQSKDDGRNRVTPSP